MKPENGVDGSLNPSKYLKINQTWRLQQMIKILATTAIALLLATGASAHPGHNHGTPGGSEDCGCGEWEGSGSSFSAGGSAGGALGASAFGGWTLASTSSGQGSTSGTFTNADINGGETQSFQTSGGYSDMGSASLGFAGSGAGSAYGGASAGWGSFSFND